MGQSHDSITTYLAQTNAHLVTALQTTAADLMQGASPPMQVDPLPPTAPPSSASIDNAMEKVTSMILDLNRSINLKIDQKFEALERRISSLSSARPNLPSSGPIGHVPSVNIPPAQPAQRPNPPPRVPTPKVSSTSTPVITTPAVNTPSGIPPKPAAESMSQAQIQLELEKGKPGIARKKALKARLCTIQAASTPDQFATIAASTKPWSSAFHSSPDEWFSAQDWAGTERICLGTEEEHTFTEAGRQSMSNPSSFTRKQPSRPTTPTNAAPTTISQVRAVVPFNTETMSPPRPNIWNVRLPEEVPEESRMSSIEMLRTLQARIPPDAFPVQILSVAWPKREGLKFNVLRIEFTDDTPETNILAHGNLIVNLLSHTLPTGSIFFHKIGPSSKMLLHSVRCRETSSSPLISLPSIIATLRKDFLVFGRLKFVQEPAWVGDDFTTPERELLAEEDPAPVPKIHRSVFITFEDDTEKSLAHDLRAARLFYLGDRIWTAHSTPRAEVVQCNLCWTLLTAGNLTKHQASPEKCKPCCKICADVSHEGIHHHKYCRDCVTAGITSPHQCTHFACSLCQTAGHGVDDERCPRRLAYISETEERVALLQAGQFGGRGGSRGGMARGK